MQYGTNRAGHGRWTAVFKPAPGILWTDDSQALGFVPSPGTDASPVLALIEERAEAGDPAATAFDALAAAIGGAIDSGDIDVWQSDRQQRRPLR